MIIDVVKSTEEKILNILSRLVIPRPIAWILTQNRGMKDSYNLAPYSSFSVISSEPAIVCLGIKPRKDGGAKDTLVNLEGCGECNIFLVSHDFKDQLESTGRTSSYGHSETCDLPWHLKKIKSMPLPVMEEANVVLYCKFYEAIRRSDFTTTIVLLKVLKLKVPDTLILNKQTLSMDLKKMNTICHLGPSLFGAITKSC